MIEDFKNRELMWSAATQVVPAEPPYTSENFGTTKNQGLHYIKIWGFLAHKCHEMAYKLNMLSLIENWVLI